MESKIIKIADALNEVKKVYGGAQFADMRDFYWKTGSTWIEVGKRVDNMKTIDLVFTQDGPETYAEMENVTLALIDKGAKWLCLFDNKRKITN